MLKSIKTAIIIPLLVALTVGVAAMAAVIGSLSSDTAERLTNANIDTSAQRYATEFSELCQGPYGVAAAITPLVAASVNSAYAGGIADPRGYVIDMFNNVLKTNDIIAGIWTCWETNAYDGKDGAYIGKYGHDATGRFVPYVFKGEKGIEVSPLVDYDTSEYYLGARDTGKPYMTDPYPYDINGKETLFCTMAVPIVKNGKVAGVVGVDINLNSFIETMNASHLLGDGYLFVLSPGGIVASHPRPELIMKPYDGMSWTKAYKPQFEEVFKNGGEFTAKVFSDVLQANMYFKCESVTIGDTNRHWLVCGVVPEATVAADSTRLLWAIALIGAVLFAVVGMTSYIIAGRVSKPLVSISRALNQIGTTGNLKMPVEVARNARAYSARKDEIGVCMRAFTSLIGRLAAVGNTLQKVAEGDLRDSLAPLSDKDTMGNSLQHMVENLNGMFGEINKTTTLVSATARQVVDTARSIAGSASHMSDGAQLLAEGSAKQTGSVEKLSGAIAEVAAKTRANSDMTEQAAGLTGMIIDKAREGSRQMDEMTAAVNDINEASKSIRAIIETINSIAQQTNLLALNAAIEAARAGIYGKGFAVVAEEVRKLAAQSAQAVKETGTIIQNSIDKAEQGARVAAEMEVSLTGIVTGINESNRLITEVSRASAEQSANIAHINRNIEQVAEIVEQNSALAEESAAAAQESAAAAHESEAASDEMSNQFQLLEQHVARFKLKEC